MRQITVSKQIPGYTRKRTLQNSEVCLLRHTLLRYSRSKSLNLNFSEKSSENVKLFSFPLSLLLTVERAMFVSFVAKQLVAPPLQ